MVEDYQRPALSWPIIVSVCVYTFIFLFVFNDFMQHATGTEYVSVSSVESTAESVSPYMLPQSSFVPHHDGDILNVSR